MRSCFLLTAFLAATVATSAPAAPIVYEGVIAPGGTVTGWLEGRVSAHSGSLPAWWSFDGAAGQSVSLRGARLSPGLDLAFSLYFGTTSADTSAFHRKADFGGLDFLAYRDDDWGPNLVGPWQDPHLIDFLLPATGSYSVAVQSRWSDERCGSCSYALTLTGPAPVSAPGTLALAASALLLAAVSRRRARG